MAAREAREQVPGVEWLLDNQHMVRAAVEQTVEDLPEAFYAVLPKIDGGPLTRAEAVVRAVPRNGSGFLSVEVARDFVAAFQRVRPLEMAELWAIPALLRLVVVEDILAVGAARVSEQDGGGEDRWGERIAAGITTLRGLEEADWKGFFESLSVVERCLRGLDPAGAYAELDFPTRDRYRKAVEELARWGGGSELAVARAAVLMARGEGPQQHVGPFLIGSRRECLEEHLGCRVPWLARVRRWLYRGVGSAYFASVASLSLALVVLMTWPARGVGPWMVLLAAVAALLPALALSVGVANAIFTRLIPPRSLPRMEFADGVPPHARTVVAVPVLLTHLDDLTATLGRMETNYLGNADPNVCVALLADLPDSDREQESGDRVLIEAATTGVRELNARHGEEGPGPFLLLVRRRRWNPGEHRWMAWERKRGKLDQLNRWILTGDGQDLELAEGDGSRLGGARYVLTLDADTSLPPDGLVRLVGVLEHPMNRPVFGADGSLAAGYTVLQPRVETVADTGASTWFQSVFHGEEGLDLYSHAVSDVYQDLFGDAIYVGKGLYDVEAFARCLDGRVPDSTLLSHDLFEGGHGRVGLVTDITVLEGFPPGAVAFFRRVHRWARGDWQLLPWLFRRVRHAHGHRVPNGLNPLARWKLLDNLRRNLLAVSLLFLAAVGWLVLPGSAWWWTGWVILTPAIPMVLGALGAVPAALGRRRHRSRFRPGSRAPLLVAARAATWVAFLPWRAAVEVDASVRTLWRLGVSRRHLLEWSSAAHTERSVGRRVGLRFHLRHAYWGPVVAASLVGLLTVARPGSLPAAAILLGLWLLSPIASWMLARPLADGSGTLHDADLLRIREVARRTWAYFETFVTPDEHWLPPDHVQVEPDRGVAHRTSPTNIGFGILSAVAAHDLGYLPLTHLAARLANTADTLERLERHRGHFLNWYDTRDLHPLAPRYVSTVDSGNLAACLLATAAALPALAGARQPRASDAHGLADTLRATADECARVGATEVASSLRRRGAALTGSDAPMSFGALVRSALEVREAALRVTTELEAGPADPRPDRVALRTWLSMLDRQAMLLESEIRTLFPWTHPALRPPDSPGAGAWLQAVGATAIPTLRDVPAIASSLRGHLDRLNDELPDPWATQMRMALQAAVTTAEAALAELTEVEGAARRLAREMEFGFLYDRRRKLLHVGYDVDAGTLDRSYYDLFASEARLASYVAMSKGDLPVEHWLRLGRPFRRSGGSTVLLSWGGSMFEYLMPSLFLHTPRGSLGAHAGARAVDAQVDFARHSRVPWGISESGYAELDAGGRYRYRAFGVPSLRMRRESDERIVIAPYATALALVTHPRCALENLERLDDLGLLGPHGFLEAADYGAPPTRPPRRVGSVMAHHQGMFLASLHHVLTGGSMVERFHSAPAESTLQYLLQEESPLRVSVTPAPVSTLRSVPGRKELPAPPSWVVDSRAFPPATTVLSNGSLRTTLTAAGAGGLRWNGREAVRWHPDPTVQDLGLWLWVRDLESEDVWSATLAPSWVTPDRYEVRFGGDRVDFNRDDGGLRTRMTVAVAPGDVEVRRVTLVNEGDRDRSLELTSYGEVSLAPVGEDSRHPAFARLFVEAEFVSRHQALLFRRRSEGLQDGPAFLAHGVVGSSGGALIRHHIDRGAFLGRDGRPGVPPGLTAQCGAAAPADEVRAPLDPVFSLTWRIRVPAGGEVAVGFLTAVGSSRRSVLRALDDHRSMDHMDWVFNRAREQERLQLDAVGAIPKDVPLFHRLLSALIHPYHRLRAGGPAAVKEPLRNVLWPMGISGDHPVAILVADDSDDLSGVDVLLRAHDYWERRGVPFDLVVVGRVGDGYEDPVAERVARRLAEVGRMDRLNRGAGVHLVSRSRLGAERLGRLLQAASLVLEGYGRSLEELLQTVDAPRGELPPLIPILSSPPAEYPADPIEPPDGLLFFNGFGGFRRGGRDYVMHLQPGERPPAPWVNVLANPRFGALVSESGSACTWGANSGESRLTPWSNDPVRDPAGEALYLRDEETGEFWSPTPGPVPADAPYQVLHRPGRTRFRHRSHGLDQRVDVWVLADEAVKVTEVRLENRWQRPRRITLTAYAEWVLGGRRWEQAPYLVTQLGEAEDALLAFNPFAPQKGLVGAFLATDASIHGFTCDRHEFLGLEGDRARPAALSRIGLSSTTGGGLDPCGALQVHVDLEPGASRTLRFFMGSFQERVHVAPLLSRLREDLTLRKERARVRKHWSGLLNRTRVRTPEPSMDILLNGWLLHQTLSCRLWGRTGFYQSSGAYGFRDQLQDSMAFLGCAPELCRERILDAAAHQFPEGDVLHWWHPDTELGVRTRCSDDRLWLPFVTAAYVEATGDQDILDENVPFRMAPPLAAEEKERFGAYTETGAPASLHEHCLRALERPGILSPRGLPLMGTGDWNDGLNHVGPAGRGESTWLAWFLVRLFRDVGGICATRGDSEHARALADRADALTSAMEEHAWDGAWYVRGTYDDGHPLGSARNEEGRIDSLPQSWAVLSRGGDPARGRRAMEAVWRELVDHERSLCLLLAPPYHRTSRDPGYIKSYPPGVRENGGQYTHAAAWVAWAFAELGDGNRAGRLFRYLDPVLKSDSREAAELYRVEPYVSAADVYAGPEHAGRGGWTWYTGSAAWLYRLGLEAILGIRFRPGALCIDPCVPASWPGFRVRHRHGSSCYDVRVRNPDGVEHGVISASLDGDQVDADEIPLADDGRTHRIEVVLGRRRPVATGATPAGGAGESGVP